MNWHDWSFVQELVSCRLCYGNMWISYWTRTTSSELSGFKGDLFQINGTIYHSFKIWWLQSSLSPSESNVLRHKLKTGHASGSHGPNLQSLRTYRYVCCPHKAGAYSAILITEHRTVKGWNSCRHMISIVTLMAGYTAWLED